MCNEQQLILKKVGYLTTALVLDEHHELIILIINTLQQDLRSDNHLVGACPTALSAARRLTPLSQPCCARRGMCGEYHHGGGACAAH